MAEIISNAGAIESVMKIASGVLLSFFAAFAWIVAMTWKASAKVTNLDASLQSHAAEARNHAQKDEREFSLIAKALESQKDEFSALREKLDDKNTMLQKLIASSEVHFQTIKDRFDNIEERIDRIKGQA